MKVLFRVLFTLLICIALVEPHWRHLTKHLHHSRHYRNQRQHRHAGHKPDNQRYWHGPRYYRAPTRPLRLGYGSSFNAGCRCLDGACIVVPQTAKGGLHRIHLLKHGVVITGEGRMVFGCYIDKGVRI